MNTSLSRHLHLYRTLNQTFGFSLRPLRTYGLLQAKRLFTAATLTLDRLLYPEVDRLPIKKPVFILGNPRSGTTFTHRFLLGSGELCSTEIWEMLFPAISARKLLGPVVDRLAPLSPARYHDSKAHQTSLRDVETADAIPYLNFADGPVAYSYYLAWRDGLDSEPGRRAMQIGYDPALERSVLALWEACWRRDMLFKQRPRILVKSPSLTTYVDRLVERYPDSKLIYLVRDPVEALPSGASLMTGVLERSHDMWKRTRPEDRARFFENLYLGSCYLYRSFHEMRARGAIPERQLLVITYPELIGDLEGTMRRVAEFAELEPVPAFWAEAAAQGKAQRERKSEHNYRLSDYGLDEARIRQDLAFVYETYGLARG